MARSDSEPSEREILVGGQALIEGVLMRTPNAYGIAVRRPDGELALRSGRVESIGRRFPILKLPLLRGIAVLFQSLALGTRALNYSAEIAATVPETAANGEADPSTTLEAKKTPKRVEVMDVAIVGSLVVGLLFGVGLFLFLPLWVTHLAERHLTGELSGWAFNLIDGGLRAVFFLVYLLAISRIPDIRRVFGYHGAEHKVVFVEERRLPRTVEAAREQSRFHPRCGTSFLLFVLIASIALFALIPKTAPFALKFGGRLALVPMIAGLAYEILRWTAAHSGSPLFSVLVAPGLALQRITTQEPTDDMLRVALAALTEALREEEGPATTFSAEGAPSEPSATPPHSSSAPRRGESF